MSIKEIAVVALLRNTDDSGQFVPINRQSMLIRGSLRRPVLTIEIIFPLDRLQNSLSDPRFVRNTVCLKDAFSANRKTTVIYVSEFNNKLRVCTVRRKLI